MVDMRMQEILQQITSLYTIIRRNSNRWVHGTGCKTFSQGVKHSPKSQTASEGLYPCLTSNIEAGVYGLHKCQHGCWDRESSFYSLYTFSGYSLGRPNEWEDSQTQVC